MESAPSSKHFHYCDRQLWKRTLPEEDGGTVCLLKSRKKKKTLRSYERRGGGEEACDFALFRSDAASASLEEGAVGKPGMSFWVPAPGAGQRQAMTGRPRLGGTGWPAGIANTSLGGQALHLLYLVTWPAVPEVWGGFRLPPPSAWWPNTVKTRSRHLRLKRKGWAVPGAL